MLFQLHRDVLEPLSPVLAQEYLELAPHRLSFDDLEVGSFTLKPEKS